MTLCFSTGLCLLLFVPCNCVPDTMWVHGFHTNAQSVFVIGRLRACVCYLLHCNIQLLFCWKSTHIPPGPQQCD